MPRRTRPKGKPASHRVALRMLDAAAEERKAQVAAARAQAWAAAPAGTPYGYAFQVKPDDEHVEAR